MVLFAKYHDEALVWPRFLIIGCRGEHETKLPVSLCMATTTSTALVRVNAFISSSLVQVHTR